MTVTTAMRANTFMYVIPAEAGIHLVKAFNVTTHGFPPTRRSDDSE